MATPTLLPVPVLLAPVAGQRFVMGDTIVLGWRSVGTLPQEGYYVVTLTYQRGGVTWTDETPWTRATSWTASEHAYLPGQSDDGLFRWSVRVMRRTGTDAKGRPIGVPISPPSAERTFVWTQRGDATPTPTTYVSPTPPPPNATPTMPPP